MTAISWTGGSGNWSNTADWSTHTVPGSNDTVSIPTSGITVTLGVPATIQSIQSSANLALNKALTVTLGMSSVSGSLMIGAGSSLTTSGTGTSFTASGTTSADETSVFANGGGTLSLPDLASYAAAASNGSYFQAIGSGSVINLSGLSSVSSPTSFLNIDASAGGRVNLPHLATITNAYVDISAENADAGNVPGTVNLPALTSFSDTSGAFGDLSATHGGAVIDPLLTTVNGVNIKLDQTNPAVASQLSLSQLTNIDGSNLNAYNGAILSLPSITATVGATFEAFASGSVITLSALTSISTTTGLSFIDASEGGRVNLPKLATLTNIYVSISADGTDANHVPSTINLPALTSFSDTSGAFGDLSATDGGDVIDPLLTTVNGANISLDQANPAVASQLDLSQLTNIDNSSLYAKSGATMSLPGITSYTGAGSFQATGSGSVITLSQLTSISAPSSTLFIYGREGGRVNLPKLMTLSNADVDISADGADANNVPSTVYLPDLTSFNDTIGPSGFLSGDLSATNGGEIIDPLLTTAKGVSITLDQANPAVASQLNVSSLTNIDGSSLFANSGATLPLPNIASYVEMSPLNSFQVTGSGSVVTLSGLTSVSTTTFGLSILASSGGRVNLPKLATITDAYVSISADGADASNVPSSVNLPALTSFSDTTFPVTGDLSATNGGDIIAGTSIAVAGVAVTFDAASTLTTTNLTLNAGSTLSGAGTFAGSVNNQAGLFYPGGNGVAGSLAIGGSFTQGANGATNVDLGGATTGTEYDQVTVSGTATFGGTLNVLLVNSFLPSAGNTFTLFTASGVSGKFATITGTAPGNNISLNASYTPSAFNLNAVKAGLIVTSAVINGDNPNGLFAAAGQGATAGVQRSMVEDLVYTFNQPVTISNANAAFTVAGAGPHPGTAPASLSAHAVPGSNGTQWAVVLDAGNVNATTGLGSIGNGEYSITINPGGVVAASDGTTQLAAARTDRFYRLFGDINGAEAVNALDNLQLKKALTTYNPAFDSNGDGAVNALDNLAFKKDLTVAYFGDGFVPTI